MINDNPAPVDHSVLDVIQNRWSPGKISDRSVEQEKVDSLLEAARWAPSSYNEQPWSYVVGHKGDETHAQITECLNEGNAWAREAGVLMISIAKTFFEHKHKPNRHHMHDVGCASGFMFLQATSMGLSMHEMAGFDVAKVRELFDVDEEYTPVAVIAVGYPVEIEKGSRERKPFEQVIWGNL